MSDITTPKLFSESLRGISGIYLIEHIASKKVYVGSTNNLHTRRHGHFSALNRRAHSNEYLQSAYSKYGRKAFRFTVVEECALDVLIEREQYWIDFYQSTNKDRGYNICPLAGGRAQSKETRRKIAAGLKGKPKNPASIRKRQETKLAIGTIPSMTGKAQSENQRQRVSAALKGNKHFAGKSHSAETLSRMSDAQKLRYKESGGFSQEARMKVSRANRRYWTAERRAAHSDLLCKYHAQKKKAKYEDVESESVPVVSGEALQ